MTNERPTAVAQAMATLKHALATDPDYALGWYDNLILAVYDAIPATICHTSRLAVGQDAAARFLKRAFDVDVPAPSGADAR